MKLYSGTGHKEYMGTGLSQMTHLDVETEITLLRTIVGKNSSSTPSCCLSKGLSSSSSSSALTNPNSAGP